MMSIDTVLIPLQKISSAIRKIRLRDKYPKHRKLLILHHDKNALSPLRFSALSMIGC